MSQNELWSSLRRAQYLVANGQRREAFTIACQLARQLAEVPCGRSDWNDALGTLLTYCDDPARALPFFERATALAPAHAGYRYNLATAQRMVGNFPVAEALLDSVIAAHPGDARACYARADLRTQTSHRNHVPELLRMLQARPGSVQEEILLRFAVAKELEDLASYEDAFTHLERGCNLQRRLVQYDVAEDVATLDRIIERHDRSVLGGNGGFNPDRNGGFNSDRNAGTNSDACIFILGLPRTGTTLVERVLASHSSVASAGESPAFAVEMIRAVQHRLGCIPGKLELVERALEVDPVALGQAYLEAARPPARDAPRFIDKQPLNYLYLGLIRRALPGARIIAVVREPMDTCFALYKTLFTGAYPFSYDFSDLARYYAAWHRLMLHWRACLADDDLLIVRYEELIAHQERVTRRILRHCGLPWEDACLGFQHQAGAVTTASAVQVRRGLYSTSVGKWRCYERQLAPLSDLLKQKAPPEGWSFTD